MTNLKHNQELLQRPEDNIYVIGVIGDWPSIPNASDPFSVYVNIETAGWLEADCHHSEGGLLLWAQV